jgi:hypothetical protein
MLGLTEKQRAFVVHFVETGGDNATESVRPEHAESARAAGYSDNGGSGIRVAATRLKADPRVLAAIREVTEQQLGVDLPKARAALQEIVANPEHREHFHAVKLLLAIQGFTPTAKSEVVHSVDVGSLADQIAMLEAQLPPSLLKRLKSPELTSAAAGASISPRTGSKVAWAITGSLANSSGRNSRLVNSSVIGAVTRNAEVTSPA